MQPITFAQNWHEAFPGGHVGLLAMGPVDNARRPTPLDDYKEALAIALRERFAGMTRSDLLREQPILEAYRAYYRGFNKTYHVQLQLESVAFKGRSLPAVNPLVDACFAAELETGLLTASHDLDALRWPVVVTASTGDEVLPMLSGELKQIKAGDMAMNDADGLICTILYGQDRRTAVTPATTRVLYVTYAPPGAPRGAVAAHHEALARNVRLFAPDAPVLEDAIVAA